MDVFLCVLSNSKRFLKNFEIWPIFGRKSAIFCIFRVAILVPRFLRKPLKLPQKCFKWLDFWYTDSLGCMQQSYVGILKILNFHWIMTHFLSQDGIFSKILVIFCEKMPSWHKKWVIIQWKIKICKIPNVTLLHAP